MKTSLIKSVQTKSLEIHYHEKGPSNGIPVILSHGFPYDPQAFSDVAEKLGPQGFRCFIPYLRGYGPTRFLSSTMIRSGQQAALGADLIEFMDALEIPNAILGGYDWGGRASCIVAALWPERVHGLVSCGQGYNIQDIQNAWNPAPAFEEARYWYMYYFHTQRGRNALTSNRRELCHYIWELWSPSWTFSSATWQATASSFDNPDFVEVVLHSYQHRFGTLPGDPLYNAIEERLESKPTISVPTIVLHGKEDTVDPPTDSNLDLRYFQNLYRHSVIAGVGHNLPQEAPQEFTEAVVDLSALNR